MSELEPDIINLQQVHTYRALHQLTRRLPSSYYVTYKPSLLGPKAGLVILSQSKPLQSEFCQVNRASRLLGVNVKGVLLVEMAGLSLCNVHLSANTEGNWSEESVRFYGMHKSQLTKLNNFITTFAKQPVIITGDFNVPADSELFESFIAASHLQDAFAKDFKPTFHKEFLPPGEPGRRIDHVLFIDPNKQAKAVKKMRLFDELVPIGGTKLAYLSDHSGLYASIEIALPSMKALAP